MARYPTYAPSFTIRAGGQPLPTAMRASITSLRYQDGLEGADRVELVLANEGLQWLDHPLLQVDTGFELGACPPSFLGARRTQDGCVGTRDVRGHTVGRVHDHDVVFDQQRRTTEHLVVGMRREHRDAAHA